MFAESLSNLTNRLNQEILHLEERQQLLKQKLQAAQLDFDRCLNELNKFSLKICLEETQADLDKIEIELESARKQLRLARLNSIEECNENTNTRILVSSSAKDSDWVERLKTHFDPSMQTIEIIDDENVLALEDWQMSLKNCLDKTKHVVLLVSSHFLNSPFLVHEQLPRFQERQKNGQLMIHSLIIKPCAWQFLAWLNDTQVHPSNHHPLSLLHAGEVDTVLNRLAENLSQLEAS